MELARLFLCGRGRRGGPHREPRREYSHRPGLGRSPHRARAAADPGRRDHSLASSASTGTPTPTFCLHAITDALLGAAALGDIGMHFPDTDPQWKGAASAQFPGARGCAGARARIYDRERRYHGDSGAAQAEGLSRGRFANRWRATLALDVDRVSVKFKTAEGVGPVGEGKSAEAQAVVLLQRPL